MKRTLIPATVALAVAMLTPVICADSAVASSPARQGGKSPLKVFILAGQSNMEGQAVVDLTGKDYNDGRGTLATLIADPVKGPQYKHLKNADGTWAVRDDVWITYQRENTPMLLGPLGLGYSAYGDAHHFGAELQFGHVVGNALNNQVLLIKTAWGGKSLNTDFRPPSAGGQVGPYYTKMIQQIHDTVANLKKHFPAYDGGRVELAGFVWWHGWNDMCEPKTAVPVYEQNLVCLINDVRKDLKAPKLPVVIGDLTGIWTAQTAPPAAAAIRKAQKSAAERPEFKGSVILVETESFVRKPEDSPHPGHIHHESGNAETYFLVGDALGKAAMKIQTK